MPNSPAPHAFYIELVYMLAFPAFVVSCAACLVIATRIMMRTHSLTNLDFIKNLREGNFFSTNYFKVMVISGCVLSVLELFF